MAITSIKNKSYEIGKQLGKGGVATVYIATCVQDGKKYAFKHFKPVPNNPEIAIIHSNIKKNIKNLISVPLFDENGKNMDHFVLPIDLIDNVKGGFGYIMPLVDLSKYLSVIGTWSRGAEGRPDAKAMCEICKKVALLFDRIHSRGYCYKDINEGNIYINPKGDIRIIDCDNIAIDGRKTILGTPGYIAPEVYVSATPNIISDRFSMATFFYRLMVGGYPFEGKKTARYLIDNDMDMSNPAVTKKFFCDEPLFAFDENDTSNSIRNVTDKKISDQTRGQWSKQTLFWDILPDEIKELFQKTFSECVKGESKDRRASDKMWIRAFDSVLKDGVVKCSCGRYNYAHNDKCLFCDKKLKPKIKEKKTDTAINEKPKITFIPEIMKITPEVPKSQYPTRVKFAMKTENKEGTIIASSMDGYKVYPEVFNKGSTILVSEYDKIRNVMKCKNTSGFTWNVRYANKNVSNVSNGRTIVLQEDMIITVIENGTHLLKLKVKEFQ